MSFVLLSVLFVADARPTTADVEAAVQLSRARYTAKNSPRTQSQIDEERARREMTTAVRSLTRTQSIADKETRLAAVKQAAVEIERLRHEIADAVSRQQGSGQETELDDIDVTNLSVGAVGRLQCGRGGNCVTARCQQILGPDKSVVSITRFGVAAIRVADTTSGRRLIEYRPIPSARATVVLKGYSTQGLRSGDEIDQASLDLVVVGRELMNGRTRPVLEVFDAEKPFK